MYIVLKTHYSYSFSFNFCSLHLGFWVVTSYLSFVYCVYGLPI